MSVLLRKITGMLATVIFLSLLISQIANALCPYGSIISLSMGVSKYDQVCSNQYQQFKFPVTSGRQYKVTVTPTSSSYDTDLYLGATGSVSNTSNYFAYSTNGSGNVDTVTFTASSSTSTSGYTYAAVYAYSSGTLSYYIKVEDITVSVPNTPSTPSLSQVSGGFRVSWGSVSGATSYKVYWETNSSVSESNYAGILTTSSIVYDHTNLDSGATYYYRVMACNSAGCSGLSDIQSAQAPSADLIVSLSPIPTDNAQRGTNIQITCIVARTGGLLRPVDGYVRVYVYMNQDQDPSNVSGQDLILGDAGVDSFDFPVIDLDDGSEIRSQDVTIPDKNGPFFLHVKVDGSEHWAESDEDNNFDTSGGTISIWRSGTPPGDEPFGVVVRSWNNPDVYWVKYNKKWRFVSQAIFFGLGYTDAQVQWYNSGALDGFTGGKDILNDNDGFCYRSSDDPTVFVIECGGSHPFFQWDNFLGQGFSAENIFWTSPEGLNWIHDPSRFPQAPAPMIRVEPESSNFQ